MTILYPTVRLKFQVTEIVDVIGTEMGEEFYVILGRIFSDLRSTTMGDIEGIFFDILLPKTKQYVLSDQV